MSRTVAVVLGAGTASRTRRTVNKTFLKLGDGPLILSSIRRLTATPGVTDVVVVATPGEVEMCRKLLTEGGIEPLKVVTGGPSRHGSEWNAIRFLAPDIEAGAIDVVIIHDGARPFPPQVKTERLIELARTHKGALFALPVKEELARVEDGVVTGWISSDGMWGAQTPQAFDARTLLDAFRRADEDGFEGTDTSATVERMGIRPIVLEGGPLNVKVTYPEDLVLTERLWERER